MSKTVIIDDFQKSIEGSFFVENWDFGDASVEDMINLAINERNLSLGHIYLL